MAGGAGLARKLDSIARKIESARAVNVGFIDGATYPAVKPGAETLLKGLGKLNGVGPHKPGTFPNRLRKYRKLRKNFVGPPKPAAMLYVAQVAWWQEFGTARAPARPFMRQTIAEKSSTWGKLVTVGMRKNNYDAALVLAQLGEHIKDNFVQAIAAWPADNAPLTVAIKGFNKGLIHQGIMQRHVDYAVLK